MDPKSLRLLNSPLACLLIAAVILFAFIFGRLYLSNFDPSSFVVAGDRYCESVKVPPGLTVIEHSDGFDGQFYYRLALNPFTSQRTEFGITLDAPALRNQRILYPLLAAGLSLGNPTLLPTVLILINLLGLCLIAWLSGSWAQEFGEHALLGLFIPLYPGFLLTLSRDTVEILEAALVLASLLLLRRNKAILATALLIIAILAKETAVIVALAAAITYVIERWKGPTGSRVRWYYIVFPFLVFFGWQFVQFLVWGQFPVMASGTNLGVPFVNATNALWDALVIQKPMQVRKSVELVLLFILGLAVLSHLRVSRVSRHEILSWLFICGLVVSLSGSVWIEDWTFLRVVSLFYVLGIVILIASNTKARLLVFGSFLMLWSLLFFKLLRSYTLG